MADIRITLAHTDFDASAAWSAFQAAWPQSGGHVAFSGRVRGEAHGARVLRLEIDHYPRMTEEGMRDAAEAVAARWPVDALLVVHRVGAVLPGEAIVLAAAASSHRRAAFEACDCIMDYLKSRAILWKREVTETGARWVEPRAEDLRDLDRWGMFGG